MSRSNSFQLSKVHRIVGWMRVGGIAQVEVARENLLVRIRLDAQAAPSAGGTTEREEPALAAAREPPPSTVVVASDAVGILCDRYPVGNAPLLDAGDPVRTGMTVALLRVGPLYRRIRSPSAGTLARWLVQPGERVDFGKPILELVNTSRTS